MAEHSLPEAHLPPAIPYDGSVPTRHGPRRNSPEDLDKRAGTGIDGPDDIGTLPQDPPQRMTPQWFNVNTPSSRVWSHGGTPPERRR